MKYVTELIPVSTAYVSVGLIYPNRQVSKLLFHLGESYSQNYVSIKYRVKLVNQFLTDALILFLMKSDLPFSQNDTQYAAGFIRDYGDWWAARAGMRLFSRDIRDYSRVVVRREMMN